jgi:hypothetical protein
MYKNNEVIELAFHSEKLKTIKGGSFYEKFKRKAYPMFYVGGICFRDASVFITSESEGKGTATSCRYTID